MQTKNQVSIATVLTDYTETKLQDIQSNQNVQCPFHTDTSGDSLRYYVSTNSAYCFGGCGSFTPETVVMKALGVSYQEAKSKLEVQYQLRPLTATEEEQLNRQHLLTPYIDKAHQFLTDDHRSLLYERGLKDEFINQMQIGYHPDAFDESFDESLEQLGIYFKDAEGDYVSDFVGKIIIPIYHNGDLVSVCAWDSENDPKYAFPKGVSKFLGGAIKNGAVLVEGVMDLLSLQQEGFDVMATYGATATKAQLDELSKLDHFKIAFDGDTAGEKGAKTIATAVYPKASIVHLEQGEDPNSLAVKQQENFHDYFGILLEDAQDLLDIQLEKLEQCTSKRDAAVQFNTYCVPLLAKLNEVELDATLSDISDILKSNGITKSSINKTLKSQKKNVGTDGTPGTTQGIALLYEKLLPNVSLYIDQTKETYALIPMEQSKKLVKISSNEFKHYLRREARTSANGAIISADSLNQLVNQFEADAHVNGKSVTLENRISKDGEDFVYDMSNETGTVIRINKHGWQLDESNPALFKRETHQLPQVAPVKGGSLNEFFALFSLSSMQKILLKVWLVYMLVPGVPKPILYVQAEKGSGKSDMTRSLRSIIDPSSLPSLKEPNNEDRLMNQLYHHYLPLFDNINHMPKWFIRACCTAATGESEERRKLFTDDDVFILTYIRPIIINAINRLAIEYPDFQDRTLLLKLSRIPEDKRMEHSVLVDKVGALKPEVFGAILDALSKAMAIKPTIQLTRLPRMADFALWGCAIAEALGYTQDEFLEAYYSNMEEANEETIFDHVVAHSIYEFMKNKPYWSGTAAMFLEELKEVAIDANIDVRDRLFPKSPSALSKRLNEIKSNLEDVGILVELPKQSAGTRTMTVTNTNCQAGEETESTANGEI